MNHIIPSEMKKLSEPDSLIFINEDKSYTSSPVPVVILTFKESPAPELECLRRLTLVRVARKAIPDSSVQVAIELHIDFRNQQSVMSIPPKQIETVSLEMDFDLVETDAFFESLNKRKMFLWVVSTPAFVFRALIDRKRSCIEIAQFERRSLQ